MQEVALTLGGQQSSFFTKMDALHDSLFFRPVLTINLVIKTYGYQKFILIGAFYAWEHSGITSSFNHENSNMLRSILATTLISVASMGAHATADLSYGIIMGTGIGNGDFTVGSANGIEVALRARERFPTPTNNSGYLSGTLSEIDYGHAAGAHAYNGNPGLAGWNFDWSIMSGSQNLSSYTYKLSIKFNDTLLTAFDPINGGVFDHSFGTAGITTAVNDWRSTDPVEYADYISERNLAQNSWNLGFFGNAFSFDPTATGTYSFELTAYAETTVTSRIDVIVSDDAGTALPEPGTLVLLGTALAGLAVVRRRKNA